MNLRALAWVGCLCGAIGCGGAEKPVGKVDKRTPEQLAEEEKSNAAAHAEVAKQHAALEAKKKK